MYSFDRPVVTSFLVPSGFIVKAVLPRVLTSAYSFVAKSLEEFTPTANNIATIMIDD